MNAGDPFGDADNHNPDSPASVAAARGGVPARQRSVVSSLAMSSRVGGQSTSRGGGESSQQYTDRGGAPPMSPMSSPPQSNSASNSNQQQQQAFLSPTTQPPNNRLLQRASSSLSSREVATVFGGSGAVVSSPPVRSPTTIGGDSAGGGGGGGGGIGSSIIASSVSSQQDMSSPSAAAVTAPHQPAAVVTMIRDIVSINIVAIERNTDRQTRKEVTFYDVCTTTTTSTAAIPASATPPPWQILRRFSDFFSLHESLCQCLPEREAKHFDSKCTLPSKFQLGSSQSDEFVTKRKQQLEGFLQGVLTFAKVSLADSARLQGLVLSFLGPFLGAPTTAGQGGVVKTVQQQPQPSSVLGSPSGSTTPLPFVATYVSSSNANVDTSSESSYTPTGQLPAHPHHQQQQPPPPVRSARPPHQCWCLPGRSFVCIIAVSSAVLEITVRTLTRNPSAKAMSAAAQQIPSEETPYERALRKRTILICGKTRSVEIGTNTTKDLRAVLSEEFLNSNLLNGAIVTSSGGDHHHQQQQQVAGAATSSSGNALATNNFLDFELPIEVPEPFEVTKFEVEHGVGSVVVSWRVTA